MATTFYILRATQIKARGLEQGSRPGDAGGGTKGVRMNDSNPGADGSGWYAGLCATAASRPDSIGTHQTPSAAHRAANPFPT